MAWRPTEHVVRGEVDNRVRGQVTGRIWFAGRDTPVLIRLTGNARRDLAGRCLHFVNPHPKPGLADGFATEQTGAVGEITASRKVKVPDVPLDQVGDYYERKEPLPWHWGNALYFEWFSDSNGRVCIEAADFQLTMLPDATWDMTADEERRMFRPASAADASDDEEDEAERPLTEEQADRMHEESEKLMDRIMARMDREGDDADFEKILEEEIARRNRETGVRPLTPEEEAERIAWMEEAAAEAEDWQEAPPDENDPAETHPLANTAQELALRIHEDAKERGWLEDATSWEHPVHDLMLSTMKAAAKLAGGLNGEEWPPDVQWCALTLTRLKLAHGCLEDALAAAAACEEDQLTDITWLRDIFVQLSALADQTWDLIEELRERLERGMD